MRRDLAVFYRQLALTYRSGIPLTDALSISVAACQSERLKKVVGQIEARVRRGNPLAPAFASHPDIFRDVEIALIAIGEENGQIDRNLVQLAESNERQHHETQRLVQGLIYPTCLFVAALFLPKLYIWVQKGFAAYLGSVLVTAVPFLLVLGLLGGGVYLLARSSPETFSRLLLELPFLGKSLRKLAVARFAESLAMLYAGGVEIRRSVRLAIRAIGNRHMERKCARVAEIVEKGGMLSEALLAASVFPTELVRTVQVGEKTGDLDRALESMARMNREEADRAIQTLLTLLPIAIYLLVALYVAIIVISAFAGYFRMIGSI